MDELLDRLDIVSSKTIDKHALVENGFLTTSSVLQKLLLSGFIAILSPPLSNCFVVDIFTIDINMIKCALAIMSHLNWRKRLAFDHFMGHGGSDGVHGYMYSLDAAVNDLKIVFLYRNHGICDKNPSVAMHRPITRKIPTQISNQNQPCQVETKKLIQNSSSIMIEKVSNKVIIDVDEYIEDSSFSDPMFVKHTEAILDEVEIFEDIDLMEVEMEDIVEELILDIDSCDSKNTLAVIDYIDDIYAHYKKTENSSCVSPNYMVQQSDINEKMRVILVDWLIEVHYKFELMDETLFLMVNIIDRFLARQIVERKKLQLVGITAMILSCKYEEVSVPVVDDLILISDKDYTRKEVLSMEKSIVNTLKFNMSVPTSYVFIAWIGRFLELLSFFLIDLSLVDHDMLRLPPSLLAVAAIYAAQFTLNRTRHWSKITECIHITQKINYRWLQVVLDSEQ
ncbi:G2/mitotic-specific cyclin-2-like [Papaver somniferum]|uniref:G2/mitotic-specific cyclin-2-like n=1 Tax=Papaver somniferum TaxID=3469 RepID=UPI000E6FC055|nr:G2/mitotic-specific cyclin-2-like [Papaver somniferum]